MTNRYIFTFVEEVTCNVVVAAQTEDEAKKIVEEGNFNGEEILERIHLEVLDIHREERQGHED